MTFRILSLDGRGPWSLIQIMTLIDLYRSGGALLTGHHVLRDFDLVVANSGGSVILGGLIKDLPLADIQKYFDDPLLRRAIFPPLSPWSRPVARLVAASAASVRAIRRRASSTGCGSCSMTSRARPVPATSRSTPSRRGCGCRRSS